MLRPIALGLLLVLATTAMPAHAQGTNTKAGDTVLVFDASGSMWGQIDGVPKITIARDVVKGLLDDLPAERRLGLVAYGHRRKGDCKDIQTMVPVGGGRDAIAKAIAGMNPVGMTPMTAAVEQAAEALKYTENQATVILVSDGQETCHADPCAAAEKLAKLGVGLTVHTVGFGLGKEEAGAKGELKCMADATGGRFFVADDADQLRDALQKISVAPSTKPKTATPAPAKTEPVAAAEPEQVATGKATLAATDQAGGPVIRKDLVWTVQHGATGEVLHKSRPGGTLEVELPRGVHDVSVRRESDGATAKGEIKLTGDSAKLSLPIVVELNATLKFPATAATGSKVRIIWTGPDETDDYISVGAADAENSRHGNYTRVREGNPLQLLMPPEAGSYEVRYVSAKNHDVLARERIEVGEIGASMKVPATAAAGATLNIAWTGPDYSNDYISVAEVGSSAKSEVNYTRTSTGNPLKLVMPPEAGTYEVRYVQQQSHKILASEQIEVGEVTASFKVPATAPAGSTLNVAWTGPNYRDDYISVAKVGSAGKTEVNYTRLSTGNPVKLLLPAEPGTYEVRYIQQQSHKILASEKIEATAVTASLEAPATGVAGSKIKVSWTGPDYSNDYISVAEVGSAGRSEVGYERTAKGSPLELKLPDEPGTYELRYVQNQTSRVLASKRITVTAGP